MHPGLPLSRQNSLIVKRLPDEVLVYDLERDKAHCLNKTAATIWENCDGKRTVAQLRELLENEINLTVPEEVVWLALDQLEKYRLLDQAPPQPIQLAGITRRELVRRIGIAAVTFPLIISIVAPSAQAQASGFPNGFCCNNPADCQSNNCVQNPTCTGIPAPSTKACLSVIP